MAGEGEPHAGTGIGSAGEERQQLGQELGWVFEVRNVAAVGYHHPRGMGDVARGRGGKRGPVRCPPRSLQQIFFDAADSITSGR